MKFLLITLSVLAFYTCNTSKTTQESNSNTVQTTETVPTVVLDFKKGGCHGTCPIYKLTLYSDGKAEYDGIRFSDRLGIHTKQLPQATIDALIKDCEAANIFAMPDRYESRIPDLASSTLTYHRKDGSKTVFWREQADDALKAIGQKIEAIANDKEGWILDESQALPKGAIPHEFIVHLNQDVDARRFMASYAKYGMNIKERLHPNGSYYLFEYSTENVKPMVFLQELNRDKRVINAEFNKRVSQRGN